MNEIGVYNQLKTLANHMLRRYGESKDRIDPAKISGFWCKDVVKWGYCDYKELGVYLKTIAKDVNNPDKFEYLMDPSELMGDHDLAAVIWDDIFNENYEFYRRIKKQFPDMK
jgi:hypothetical protein